MNAWILAVLFAQPLARVEVETFTGDAQLEIAITEEASLSYDSGRIDDNIAPGWRLDAADGVKPVDVDGDGRTDRIDLDVAGQRVRRYRLDYDAHARLASVQVLGQTDGDRLPPMRFAYDERDRLRGVDNGIGAVTTLSYHGRDVSQLVVQTGPGAVTITEQYRYAEPTDDDRGYGVVEIKRSDSVGTPPRYERHLFYRGETGRTYRVPERMSAAPWPDHASLSGQPLAVLAGPSADDFQEEAWSAWTVSDAGAPQLAHYLELRGGRSYLTDYHYDRRGRLTRIDDHDGTPSTPSRAPEGEGEGGGLYTTIRYDGDEVIETRTTTEPGGGQTLEHVRYSRGPSGVRVDRRTGNERVSTHYMLDAAGRPTRIEERGVAVDAKWDAALGVVTEVARSDGARIHSTYDGFGRLVRETGANGETLREIDYALHPQLPNRIRERTAAGTRTVFLDGWMRPVSTTVDDGVERTTTTVRYTHTETIDRIARDWSPSQTQRHHFGPADDTQRIEAKRNVLWNGEVRTTFVVTEDAIWQIDFDPTTNTGTITLPDGRRFNYGADLEPFPIPTFDAGDCRTDPGDAAEQLADALVEILPYQPDPKAIFDEDGNVTGVEIYNGDGLVAVLNAGRSIGGEPHFAGVAAWNWAVRSLVGTTRSALFSNPFMLTTTIPFRDELDGGLDTVEEQLRLPYYDERGRQAGEGAHPLGEGVQPLLDVLAAVVLWQHASARMDTLLERSPKGTRKNVSRVEESTSARTTEKASASQGPNARATPAPKRNPEHGHPQRTQATRAKQGQDRASYRTRVARRGPKFGELKDHHARHGLPDQTAAQYYEDAVDHTLNGKKFTVRHDGKTKTVFITRTGPDQFTFTSTTPSGNRIYTHSYHYRLRDLTNKGIALPDGF